MNFTDMAFRSDLFESKIGMQSVNSFEKVKMLSIRQKYQWKNNFYTSLIGWNYWPWTSFLFFCLYGTANYYVCPWRGGIGQGTERHEIHIWREHRFLLFAYLWSYYSSETYNRWRLTTGSWAFSRLRKGMCNKKPLFCFFWFL